MSPNNQKPWVAISIAIIGLIGTVTTAYITSQDKTTQLETPSPTPTPEENPSPVTPDPQSDQKLKQLAIEDVTVESDNVLSPEYGPKNLKDNDCSNKNYWATREGSSNDAVLDFTLLTPSTVSEARLYSMRYKGRATQPKRLALEFFDDSGNEIGKQKELRQEKSISRDWVKHKFDPVKGVKRIQMRLLEPLNASGIFLSFNEVRFYGPSTVDPKIVENNKVCLNYQKDFNGERI